MVILLHGQITPNQVTLFSCLKNKKYSGLFFWSKLGRASHFTEHGAKSLKFGSDMTFLMVQPDFGWEQFNSERSDHGEK